MIPTIVLLIVAVLVVVATALALAGRWQPEGIGPATPADPDRPQFDVVLRGYRMEQVDAEIERLRGLLQQAPVPAPGDVPSPSLDSTIEEWPSPQPP